MYQKDYILRMIAMLINFIGEVLGLIRKNELQKASEMLESGYLKFLKEDAAFFRRIPAGKLTRQLLHDHNYTNGHLEILAELFNAEAELRLAQGNPAGSLEYSEKSLRLFEFLDREQKTWSLERINKMDTIRNRIKSLSANTFLPGEGDGDQTE